MSNIETVGVRERETIAVDKTTLSDLLVRAERIQGQCVDYNVSDVSDRNMRFNPVTGQIHFQTDEGQNCFFDMSRYAMGQMCTKLGVPARYIEKCIESGQLDLAGENVNTWLSDYGKNLFLRAHQNRIRGVLTDRYTVLDAPEIIGALADVIDPDDYRVKGHYLTPERFHARIVQKDQLTKVDDLFAGIQVDSSDVGRSILTVSFFIYKQVCTNGLVIAKQGGILFSQKHIGQSVADFRSDFQTAVAQIPALAVQYNGIIESARDQKIKDTQEEVIATVRRYTDLSEDAANRVLSIREEKYDNTQWGLINAITEVAQDFTLERRLEIERAAGNMLLRVA